MPAVCANLVSYLSLMNLVPAVCANLVSFPFLPFPFLSFQQKPREYQGETLPPFGLLCSFSKGEQYEDCWISTGRGKGHRVRAH